MSKKEEQMALALPLEAISDLNVWRDEVHGTACAKGWHDVPSCQVKASESTVPSADGSTEPLTIRHPPVNINYDRVSALLALTHQEVSEALDELRKGPGAILTYFVEDDQGFQKPEGLEAELADVIIRCLDIAGELNLDLRRALILKAAYNKTRKHRHGGRTV